MPPIYLDYNASTPIDPAVAAAMRPFLDEDFGNPSSGHWASTPAKSALEKARGQIASLLGSAPEEIVFTSDGSEANNLAIKGTFFALKHKVAHIITTAVEHPAVLAPAGLSSGSAVPSLTSRWTRPAASIRKTCAAL
jgi:cysteine desulfurase